MTIELLPDAGSLAQHIADKLAARVRDLQADGVTPSIVLTGGTIAIAAYELISADSADWAHVDFWWGDERFVAADNPDYNALQAREAFLDRVGADPLKVHPIPPDDGTRSAAESAAMYAAHLPARAFDIVLLGVGPDGHIASLFPGVP
ncbi:MAG: pgl, partial [Nocardioidaceae bacterium]|nr:pgl [Nocardioidaceae bacterium]